MILYHGSNVIVKYPEIRKARYNKDFYFGFYCTKYAEQAERWAASIEGTCRVLGTGEVQISHPSGQLSYSVCSRHFEFYRKRGYIWEQKITMIYSLPAV